MGNFGSAQAEGMNSCSPGKMVIGAEKKITFDNMLASLNEDVQVIGKLVDTLAERINPILTADCQTETEKVLSQSPICTPLAQAIHETMLRICRIRRRLCEIHDRIAV
jgi:hypothetical protein